MYAKKEIGSISTIKEKLDKNILEVFCPKKKDRKGNLYPIPELPSLLTIGKGYHQLQLNMN